jgi:predicted NAD-dependent protein-ADP-ribosyltransferase YbiA (DUF1768 family)
MKKTTRPKIVAQHPQLVDPRCEHYQLENRAYERDEVIVIDSIKHPFGELLNMPNVYPTIVNGVFFRNLEGLYQCMRYPKLPELQQRIIDQKSAWIGKHIALSRRDEGRANWYQVKVIIMRWCLHVKIARNYDGFGLLLDSTGEKTIVESSPDGNFWGGVPLGKSNPASPLYGANVFGQLLMELRAEYRMRGGEELQMVMPLDIEDFLLLGQPIEVVDCRCT